MDVDRGSRMAKKHTRAVQHTQVVTTGAAIINDRDNHMSMPAGTSSSSGLLTASATASIQHTIQPAVIGSRPLHFMEEGAAEADRFLVNKVKSFHPERCTMRFSGA